MYNSTLYILDGENYCYLDTKENKVKKVIPYNPLITINKKPKRENRFRKTSCWNIS